MASVKKWTSISGASNSAAYSGIFHPHSFAQDPRAFHDIESRHATVEKSRVNELNHSKLKRSKEVFSSYFSILENEAIPPFFFFPTRHLSSIVLMQNKIKRSLSFLIDVALFALIRLILVAINLLLTDRILNSRRRLLTL